MKLSSLKDTQKLAKKISQIIKSGDTVFLYGEIGAGKTTFVRFFINNLEKFNKVRKSNILSPTFNIVYDYKIKKTKILHYDLYRLKSYNDILELGIFENEDKHIKIIEWPELIKLKPKNRIEITLKYSKLENSRNIKINSFGKCKNYKLNEL
tara:strand:+ start:280 stop:735 length:456 start_codon:yes stop_codon:yes gene_type:complete